MAAERRLDVVSLDRRSAIAGSIRWRVAGDLSPTHIRAYLLDSMRFDMRRGRTRHCRMVHTSKEYAGNRADRCCSRRNDDVLCRCTSADAGELPLGDRADREPNRHNRDLQIAYNGPARRRWIPREPDSVRVAVGKVVQQGRRREVACRRLVST